MGISHGGWFAARSLALSGSTSTNHARPAAFVADPGILRLIDGVLPQFPDEVVERFHERDRDGFDEALTALVDAPGAANDLLVTARTVGDPFGTTVGLRRARPAGRVRPHRSGRPTSPAPPWCATPTRRGLARPVRRARRRAGRGPVRRSRRSGGVHDRGGRRARLRDPGPGAAQPAGVRLAGPDPGPRLVLRASRSWPASRLAGPPARSWISAGRRLESSASPPMERPDVRRRARGRLARGAHR